jgi:ornithine carbamoyltransferase
MRKFRGRHFLDDQDFDAAELREMLDLAIALKELWRRRPRTPLLPGRHLGMFFEFPSTRTRLSFETGMAELGGDAPCLRPGEIHMPGKESVADTARTFALFCDAAMLRLEHWPILAEFADASPVPVINGMITDRNHPCQAMTDAMTILELTGGFEGVTVACIGPTDCMLDSDVLTLSRLGMNVRVASPMYSTHWGKVRKQVLTNCAAIGATFYETDDPADAVSEADFVIDITWTWYGMTEAEKERVIEICGAFQVNSELWRYAKKGARYMNCLPAVRGQHVTDEIIDGPQSVVWHEAENRKHFQKGLLLALIGIDELPEDPDLHEIGRALLS